ncbi:hypothetical protein O6H91_11G037900 [Diphasiastrum complanatum]|uniref:Uncharacterized protein n=1 Tax=Diphasiastrum complanatum TaxID=34168 RepID=A0ACC2C9A1_DIPCM|nr:hypothetical protein O6H91_11G037900 [Diphasiastrum complanatum]
MPAEETAVLHAEYCSSSLDSANTAESSFSPSFRLRVQKRLTELAAPIRTSIRMSSTRNTATQKGFKQLRDRSNMIRNSCAFELKKDDKISVDLDVSTKPSMHNILRSSSFSVNSRSQIIDEHRNRNTFTSMNVMQTKGKAIESNTCSRLAILNEHAVIGGSSLLLVLSTLSLGRFPAILFTSMSWIAILFIKAYHETGSWTSNGLSVLSLSSKSFSQEINKSSTSATYQMDFTSNKYKKKVIMEGILERNHGIFQT